MKLSHVPWSDLSVGQPVCVTSPTDVMGGVIVRLEREPMIWIAWDDGNHSEYHQSVLSHVDVSNARVEARTEFDFDAISAEKLIPDVEGE